MIHKTFGTVLKSNSQVAQRAKKFSSTLVKKKTPKVLPKSFNPIKAWGNYLSPIRNQGECGDCYAQTVTSILTDRFNLLTLGQFFQTLSAKELTICAGVLGEKVTAENTAEINMKAHSNIGCTGYTIYDAVEFLYMYGAVPRSCFDSHLAEDMGVDFTKLVNPSDLPYCSRMLSINFDKCLDGKTPARFFRAISQNAVGKNPEEIKMAIYHWGPVATGFNVYSNFLNDYDGTTIYMGPTETDTPQGGHAIRILGWGEEKGVPYWWCANSWGVSWGLQGYFKMMINCPKCQLEENVIEFLPDIPTINELGEPYFDYKPNVNAEDRKKRDEFGVDNLTGYKFSALREFKRNGIEVTPLFNVSILPDYNTFWAGEIHQYPHAIKLLTLTGEIRTPPVFSNTFLLFSLIATPLILAWILKKIKNK
jgi:cathepsin B